METAVRAAAPRAVYIGVLGDVFKYVFNPVCKAMRAFAHECGHHFLRHRGLELVHHIVHIGKMQIECGAVYARALTYRAHGQLFTALN